MSTTQIDSESLLISSEASRKKLPEPTREEFYTNYPFFKYWNTEQNNALVNPPGINMYIHIPFCIQICDYCFYNKELITSKDQVDQYIDYLCKEMKIVSEQFGLNRRNVNSIYIGGGTPSVLTEKQFTRLVTEMHKYFRIEKPEFTFEAEPGTFSENKIATYKENGVNRISMGVQSFNDEIIRLSSRKHTAKQAIHSVEIINKIGGIKTNIDLLSGLLGESMSTWDESLRLAMSLPIDLLTIYKLKVYANTNFFKKSIARKQITLPSIDEEISLIDHAIEKLFNAGFRPWSTFAFTKNDVVHAYAENTWRGQDLFAFGVSSFGKIGNINYQNVNGSKLYFEKLDGGIVPIFRSFKLTMKDLVIKELLLCAVRLNSYRKKEFVDKFGFDYFKLIPDTIDELQRQGYIEDNHEEIELTRKGILFGDFVSMVIASSFKEKMGSDSLGFSY